MLADVQELMTLAGKGGEAFEQALYDLVVEEARRVGIPPQAISWDYRTNIADGGRDIVVRQGHGDTGQRFLPQKPSIWSAKSGKDGVEPATLREEIRASNHPKLRQQLLAGNVYVWCALHPIDQAGRDKMTEAAKGLATEIGFDNSLIEFRWCDALRSSLNDHPNLIAKHLPDVARKLQGAQTLREWERIDSFGFSVGWVEFAQRSALREQIREHLLGQGEPNVLHLAGLSGTGKTRTVLEACRGDPALQGVLFFPEFGRFTNESFRYFEAAGRQALVVIDELPLTRYQDFCDRVREHYKRLRFVTIGPARRGEHSRPGEVLILGEPSVEAGVLAVVRQAGQGLPEPVLESIAAFSAHDLRLAVLLVRATKQGSQFRQIPIRNSDDIWERVTFLFKDYLENEPVFRRHYEVLTACVDVGLQDKHREELDYLAKHFAYPPEHLEHAATLAERCGLGVVSASRFFEAHPRALAVWLFQDRLWGQLRLRLLDFLHGMPSERLRRRFLERCQECTGRVREEVEEALTLFFTAELGHNDLTRLADRQRSRVFQAWAELDPKRGLAWLKAAVRSATPGQLRELDGKPDGSGGWRGRRQLVWLCEHLACFAEHFWDCEEILFHLAQVETELAIGNNSTNTWQSMFRLLLANTEVPFPARLELLLRRLREATPTTLPLLLSAVPVVTDTFSGRMAPPTVVGGRVVPQQWQPRTVGEVRALIVDAQRRTLQVLSELEPALRRPALMTVVRDLGAFLRSGLIAEARQATASEIEDEEFRRDLRTSLEQVIALHTRGPAAKQNPPPADWVEALRSWSEELAPSDLAARVKELTAQDYWAIMRTVGY